MTHRERFYAAMNHEKVDRAVWDICGSPQTQIDSEEIKKDMAKLLSIEGTAQDTIYLDERVLKALDIDTRLTGGMPTPRTNHNRSENGVIYDSYGIGYKNVGAHYEICHNPLKGKEIDEIMRYELPDADNIDMKLIEKWVMTAKYLHENTDYAVVAEHPVLGVFEIGCWLFGFDDYLYRCAMEPEMIHEFSGRILNYHKKTIEKYYGALGRYIDATTSGDDFGTQRSSLISVEMFDDLIKPYLKERVSYTKKFTNAFFKQHTCGSVFFLIPSLIDCGIDMLNPIQPGTYMMEPERLKEAYGKKLSFWGGIDTQHLMVEKSYDEVKQEVKRILTIFGNDGGYIMSPAHCIQPDVPALNVLAIYDAAKEFCNS